MTTETSPARIVAPGPGHVDTHTDGWPVIAHLDLEALDLGPESYTAAVLHVGITEHIAAADDPTSAELRSVACELTREDLAAIITRATALLLAARPDEAR